jgi:steroid delta-isomerase-like uncharacterized protein
MTMTNQDTKQIALDHLARINAGDIEGAAALMADDCINHAALPEAQGRRGFTTILSKLRSGFPDMRYTVEDILGENDRVVLRVMFQGTHTGPLAFTRLPLAATGKAVTMEQIHLMRIAHGKIAEHWMTQDSIAMFRQLGIQLTPPA